MIFAINHLYLLKRQPGSKSLVYAKFFRSIQMASDWLISALQAEADNQAPACDRVLCASGKHVWRGLAQDASDSLRVDRSMSVNAINEMVRRRVGLRLGCSNKEDHRHAHRIDRHRFGQDHLSPGCIRSAEQNSAA